MANADPPISLDRFIWVQDFAARLVELGAPLSADLLVRLGYEYVESSRERNPVAAAELVWSQWPTGPGTDLPRD